MRDHIEILAPAGNLASLKAAIGSGADAVYLGMNKFNARTKADNFSLDNIEHILNYAHLFGVKVYVTMNTLLKDTELTEALSLTEKVWNSGADAVIIQDLGLAEKLKKHIPDIVLHASTQCGIHNYAGAVIAEKLGFERIILSRETTLEDIKQIKKNCSIDLEFFVHGALCVAFSGNCYFSSLASGYSGNRGKCMQLCRKKYTLKIDDIQKEGYYLSAKDLNNSNCLQELIKAGITSLKIEGRLRRPEYVATAVDFYKKALRQEIEEKDADSLKLAFNRGNFCNGHLFFPTSDTIYPFVPNNIGVNRGYVKKCIGGIATLSEPLNKGDGIKFLRNGWETGSAAIKSDGIITGFSGNVKKGDEVRLTDSQSLYQYVKEPKIPVDIIINAYSGKPLNIKIKTNNETVSVDSDFDIEISKTAPMNAEDIIKQMKLSDSEFCCSNIEIFGDKNIFIPKSKINETRRSALNKIKELRLRNYVRQKNSKNYMFMSDIINKNGLEILEMRDIIQIDSAEKQNIIPDNFIGYISLNPQKYTIDHLKSFQTKKMLLNMPIIARDKDLEILKNIIASDIFYGYIVNNLYALELLNNKKILFGWQMNLLNSEISYTKIASPETDTISHNSISYTFGYVPVMTFTHCPRRTLGMSCKNCDSQYTGELIDSTDLKFNIRHYSVNYCYAQLMNCLPLYNPFSEKKFIDLTEMEISDCKTLLPIILKGKKKLPILTTKGNLKRGLK